MTRTALRQPVRGVILISLDCLRADHLSCYGYAAGTSPHIDALADEGVRFDQCTAASNWTPPSHASMFTGTWPTEHGVHAFDARISSECPTAAELFGAAGWHTTALSTWRCFSDKAGLTRGFDDCLVYGGDKGKGNAGLQTENAIRWLDTHRAEPFYLFLHYGQIHAPYEVCPGFEDQDLPIPADRRAALLWERQTLPGWLHVLRSVSDRLDGERPFGRLARKSVRWAKFRFVRTLNQVILAVNEGRLPIDDEVRTFLVARYDNCIRYVDQKIGEVVTWLQQAGLWEGSLIIITGDHGDEFGEHRGVGHGHTLFQEVVRVPLIFTGGAADGMRLVSSVPASHCDILPTQLAAAGLAVPESLRGRPLWELLDNGQDARATYSEHFGQQRDKACLVRWPWKYTVDLANGGSALHNLAHDGAERSEVNGDAAAVREAMAVEIAAFMHSLDERRPVPGASGGDPGAEDLDEQLKEQLEQLGYL